MDRRLRQLGSIGSTLLAGILLVSFTGCWQVNHDVNDSNTTDVEPSDNDAEETQAETASPEEDLEVEQATIVSNSVIDTTQEGAKYRRALAAIDEGQFGIAENLQDEIRQHPTYGVLGDSIEAILLVKDNKYDKAMSIAERLSALQVMQPESHMIAGDVFRARGAWTDAIRCYNNAVGMNPGLARAHRWLGVMYYDTGAMQLATRHLRTVANIDVKDYRVLRLAGLIQYEYEDFRSAVVDYRRALRRSPPEALATQIRLELADCLRQLRRFDQAIETLAACPQNAVVEARQAQVLESQGDTAAAEKAARKSLELDKTNRTANLVLGRICLSNRQADEAAKLLQTAVERDPYDHESRILLGRALIQSGQQEAGKAEVLRSTELKEQFLEMAKLHVAASDNPEDVGVRIQLAELNESRGQKRLAATWYRAAIGLDPNNRKAAEGLKRLAAQTSPLSADSANERPQP